MKDAVSRDPQVVSARILDAAQREFMAHGYEAASTNRITRGFGGSKATLFRYFPSKEALLEAVVRRIAGGWHARVDSRHIPPDSPERWLTEFGIRTLGWLLTEELIFLGRLGIAEGHKFPKLERVFQETAGRPLQAVLAQRLRGWTRAGLLACREPRKDAERFLDLVASGAVSRRLYGDAALSGTRLTAHVKDAVALYLRGRTAPEGSMGAPGTSS